MNGGYMNIDSYVDYCKEKEGTSLDFPYGDNIMVIKVGRKMFVLINNVNHPPKMTLKCDPDKATQLRSKYKAIKPGYHMNKKNWNTIDIDGSVPDEKMFEMIDESYELVIQTLSKSKRQKIDNMRKKES
jgi:predicted DNA-binding protein (MmcQ/YjbR family)